jgi:hypothetical protein
VLQQLPDLLSPLATLLAVLLAYFFGRRQTIYERLYTERAEIIAELFKRFEDVDQLIFSLIKPYEMGSEPSKKEKANLATQGFNDLQSYYRRNSVWLSPGINRQLDSFLQRHRRTINNFNINVIEEQEQGNPGSHRQWMAVWTEYQDESPKIREALELEFRAALGWRWAQIKLAWKSLRRRRQISQQPQQIQE